MNNNTVDTGNESRVEIDIDRYTVKRVAPPLTMYDISNLKYTTLKSA